MIFDGVSFNTLWAVSITKEQFVRFHGNQHLWPKLSEKDRKVKLAQVYDLMQAQNKVNANDPKSIISKPKN